MKEKPITFQIKDQVEKNERYIYLLIREVGNLKQEIIQLRTEIKKLLDVLSQFPNYSSSTAQQSKETQSPPSPPPPPPPPPQQDGINIKSNIGRKL